MAESAPSSNKPRLAHEVERWASSLWRPVKRRPVPGSGKAGVSRYKNRTEAGLDAPLSAVMTKDVSVCTPDTRLVQVAQQMIQMDCGAIPVVKDKQTMRPEGMITDRDMVCRAAANNRNLSHATVEDCMTGPAICLAEDVVLRECVALMRETQIRRVIVIDRNDRLVGIVAVADLVKNIPSDELAALLNDICEPTDEPFREDSRGYSYAYTDQRTVLLGSKR